MAEAPPAMESVGAETNKPEQGHVAGGDGGAPASESVGRDEDVASAQAIHSLNEATSITDEVKAAAKKNYREFQLALTKTMASDAMLLGKAKGLNNKLLEEKLRLEQLTRPGDSTSAVDVLREDAEHAEQEAALCKEREQLLQLEQGELQRQKDDLKAQIEEAHQQYTAEIEPQIRQLKEEIVALRDEATKAKVKCASTDTEKEQVMKQYKELASAVGKLQQSKSEHDTDAAKANALPDRIRKQAEVVGTGLKSLKVQEGKMVEKLQEAEGLNNSVNSKLKELTDLHASGAAQLERARLMTETKERQVEDLRKEVETKAFDADQSMADQVNLDLQIQHSTSAIKHENEELSTRMKEKDNALRRHRKVELQVKQVKGALPALQATRNEAAYSISIIELEKKRLAQQMVELARERDAYRNSYMKEENVCKDKAALYQAAFTEVEELEQEMALSKKQAQLRDRQIAELSAQRERASIQAANKATKCRETQEQIRVKDLILLDLKKKQRETSRRLSDFSKLYHLVKNQRNKFVNLIQASSQNIAEMKEKLKILGNEAEILRNEINSKDKLVAKARHDLATSQVEREHLRAELNKCALVYQERQDAVDEQISEIDKLNAVINSCERDMLRMKKHYEMCVENRNHTGIMLIDRNDELCILYEKNNMMESVQKQGEIALKKNDEERRMIQLEIKNLQRKVEVTRKSTPLVPELESQIVELKNQVAAERAESARLSEELENPQNKNRWRRLEGKIPDKEELEVKASQLEERLADKKEELLEKELILEEVTSLSDRLRVQAAQGRGETLELAKRVNDYQAKIRSATRKMMATVSELSMYQASAMRLASDKNELEEQVSEALSRIDRGEAPTEDAERDWYKLERERLMKEDLARRRERESRETASTWTPAQAANIRSTAEQRPTAYIPEELGIPKPFGGFAPFKPSEQGSTMRHVRKPEPREIQI